MKIKYIILIVLFLFIIFWASFTFKCYLNACIFNILNTNSGAITGIATVVLAIITFVYVFLTKKLLNLQREQYLSENRPWVTIDSFYNLGSSYFKYVFNLYNSGKLPAFIYDFEASLFHNEKLIEKKAQILCQNYPIYPEETIPSIHIEYNGNELALSPPISDEKPLIIEINFNYYSITDKGKRNKYPLNIKYEIYNTTDGPRITEYYSE